MADYHGFDRFHYAGQSMGGLIGFELGISYPDRLLSLSLSAPAPADGIAFPPDARAEMRRRWADKERDLLIRTSLAGVPRESAHADVPATRSTDSSPSRSGTTTAAGTPWSTTTKVTGWARFRRRP